MSVREICLAACAAASAIAIFRMVFLLGWRRSVLARVLGTDYGDAERSYDLGRRPLTIDDHLVPNLSIKTVLVRAQYEWDGIEYFEDVSAFVRRGDTPGRQIILWLDPQHPTRVTASGIGVAAVCLLGIGFIAAALWYWPL